MYIFSNVLEVNYFAIMKNKMKSFDLKRV